MCYPYPIRFRLTRVQVCRNQENEACRYFNLCIYVGIFITYPTSYEALVGRAKLELGELYSFSLFKVLTFPAIQASGFSCWQLQEALAWQLFRSAKVCGFFSFVTCLSRRVAMLTLRVRPVIGARVVACASPSKLDVARTFGGADFVVDYTKDGWQKEILKITGGRGVDVVFDPVGRIKGMDTSCEHRGILTVGFILPARLRCAEMRCMGWSGSRCWLCWWQN
jgi:hypothetical protein